LEGEEKGDHDGAILNDTDCHNVFGGAWDRCSAPPSVVNSRRLLVGLGRNGRTHDRGGTLKPISAEDVCASSADTVDMILQQKTKNASSLLLRFRQNCCIDGPMRLGEKNRDQQMLLPLTKSSDRPFPSLWQKPLDDGRPFRRMLLLSKHAGSF
jgi:hypothetical protein